MKFAIIMSALLGNIVWVGSVASAGPEDRRDAQVCYHLVEQKTQLAILPSELCIETIAVDLEKPAIEIYSYFFHRYFHKARLTKLVRHTEDMYRFVATVPLKKEWNSGCGDGETIEIYVEGVTNTSGEADPGSLDIKAVRTFVNDTCHASPQDETYIYRRL